MYLGNYGVGLLQAPAQLLVQEEARELRCAGALQELDEDLPSRSLWVSQMRVQISEGIKL